MRILFRAQVRQCKPHQRFSPHLDGGARHILMSWRRDATRLKLACDLMFKRKHAANQPPGFKKPAPATERAKKFCGVKLSRALIIEAMNLGADGEDKLGAAFSHRVLTDCESALCVSRTFHIMEPINSTTLNGRTSSGNLFSPWLRRRVTERDKISASTSSFISPSIY